MVQPALIYARATNESSILDEGSVDNKIERSKAIDG
jgi:hypothetical protein